MMKRFDTQALLALIALIGAIAYQFFTFWVLKNPDNQIPAWMSAVVMGCIGYFFGSKGTNGNGMARTIESGGKVTLEKLPSE